MRAWCPLLLVTLLAACASVPVPVAPDTGRFFHDAQFRAPSETVSGAAIFALSPEMQRFLDAEIAEPARRIGRQRALVDALQRGQLKLEYDSEMTRNAAQAFAARSGNCLSLVIMTAAFAKALDLPVVYQKVFVADEWARAGDIYLAIGHVNLTLGRRATDGGGFGHRVGTKPPESEGLTIDFLPPDDMRRMRTREFGEDILVAMYMNNRAVEAMARGNLDDAYWWAREAIVQAPRFLMPYNTLGAIYQRHGNAREAEQVLALGRRDRTGQRTGAVEPRHGTRHARPHRRGGAACRPAEGNGPRPGVLAFQPRPRCDARRRPPDRQGGVRTGGRRGPPTTTSSTSGSRSPTSASANSIRRAATWRSR